VVKKSIAKPRSRSMISTPKSHNRHTLRSKAYRIWNRDELGTFEIAVLQRIAVLTDERSRQLEYVNSPTVNINSFEFKERSFLEGMPISSDELKRRELSAKHHQDVEGMKFAKHRSSRAYKRRMVREEKLLGGRRCLASLIKLNHCCGAHANVLSDEAELSRSQGLDQHPEGIRFFCADDIFMGRSQMMEAENQSKWLQDKCVATGTNSFTFDSIPICDRCFCELYQVKVFTYYNCNCNCVSSFIVCLFIVPYCIVLFVT